MKIFGFHFHRGHCAATPEQLATISRMLKDMQKLVLAAFRKGVK